MGQAASASAEERVDGLREAMRWLLLPIPVDGEGAAVEAARAALHAAGVESEDARAWIELELEDWRRSGRPSAELAAVARAYIASGDDELGPNLAAAYFRLHSKLAGEPLMDHAAASAVLSHARLIALLASEESLSAGQVAKLVAVRDERSPIAWSHVETILAALGAAPGLTLEAVQSAYAEDEQMEVEVFADADEPTCIEMVAEAGRRLGFPGDLAALLRTLVPPGETPNGPYMQILHYQCTVAEHYDHALKVLYEFNPRGQTAKWLFKRYPSSLEVAEDPFLNNAKSVDEMNREWAKSKKPAYIREAHALVAVIQGLDSMGFAARRELAAWLRRLLVRRIRLARGIEVSLPERLSAGQARGLLRAIAAAETNTRGILEQRLVDAVASRRHRPPDWIARGLLDSVNATNVSRRKCGDCDFQSIEQLRVVAYEAHAGKLSDIYVRGHMRSLEAVLEQRIKEWEENVGTGLEWRVEVLFVAHQLDILELPEPTVGGIEVKVGATTYEAFLADFDADGGAIAQAVNEYVRDPIAEPRTPDSIRSALLGLLGPAAGS
jgi:hypothetical protein